MNNRIKYWIQACRPHTLPLAFSGIILGNFFAYFKDSIDWIIFTFSILTAILLQILSNLANDYGDSKHGSDNEKRLGPERAVQSGAISSRSMFRVSILIASMAFISGLLLLFFSQHMIGWKGVLILIGFGLMAIWAAYSYTASLNPYGYKGFGDLFVFVFFGIVAVCGSFYLQMGYLNKSIWLAAFVMGFFSTAVLNLNNIRDIENDKASGKITFAVRLGLQYARHYHAFLINAGILISLYFLHFIYFKIWHWAFALPLLLIFSNLVKVYQTDDSRDYYPMLKQLSLSILLFVLSIGISFFLLN